MSEPRKKRRWLIALAGLALLIVAAFLIPSMGPEPTYQGRTVSEWARALTDPDPMVRTNAAAAIRAMGAEAIPHLTRSLNKRDPFIKKPFERVVVRLPLWLRRAIVRVAQPFRPGNERLAAINAMVELGTNAPVAPLVKALGDPERQIANRASEALRRIGRPAVPPLIEALDSPNGAVRSITCFTLSAIGPDAEQATFALMRRLNDPVPNIQTQAAYALARIGAPAAGPLAEAAAGADARLRVIAVRALGWMGTTGREAVPVLMKATADPKSSVRREAVEALGAVWPWSPESISLFIRALKDDDAEVRLKAIQAFAKVWRLAEPHVPVLVEALNDGNPQVRGWAAMLLGLLGSSARTAVPALKDRLNDGDGFVRTKTAEALQKIESSTGNSGSVN